MHRDPQAITRALSRVIRERWSADKAYDAAEFIAEYVTKPVVGFIAGADIRDSSPSASTRSTS